MERPELLKLRKGSVYEYADVYPVIYLTMRVEGISSLAKVKHLVIDEMQDYTTVQYRVLSRLFACKKAFSEISINRSTRLAHRVCRPLNRCFRMLSA